MKVAVIVGTSHKYQRPETTGADEFRSLLVALCTKHNVSGIAEELNVEALMQKGSARSVGNQIAEVTRLAHRYCDMNNAQRKSAGVIDKIQLEYEAWQNEWNAETLAARIRASEGIRERHWLTEVTSLDVWPIIFVCGACHVPHFQRLLVASGIYAQIAVEDWAPSMA